MKRGTVVVVVDTCVNPSSNSSVKIEQLAGVKGGSRAGVIKRNSKNKNVAVRVKKVCSRVDGLRSFQGDELAQFQIESPLGDDWEVQVQISFDQIGLKSFVRRAIEQTEGMDEARVAPVHELQLETPIELTGLRHERALKIDHDLVQQRLVRAIIKEPAEILITLRAVGIESDAAIDPA